MKTDAKNCFVCGLAGRPLVSGGKDYFVSDGNSPDFEIRYCAGCRLGYSLPPMTAWELRRYYPGNYEAYVAKRSWSSFLQKLKYKSDLKLLKKKLRKTGSIFEIGAGRGEFLSEAKAHGFQVAGLEPSPAGVKAAAEQCHIHLQAGFAEDIFFNKTYDAVIARHVLEHVENPASCLEKIFKEGLREGGVLLLKLPRLDSWEAGFFGRYWHGFDLPRHRAHFSRRGIRKILTAAGFRRIRVRSEVVPTDILRSVRYYSRHGRFILLKLPAKLLTSLPSALQMISAQLIGLLFSFFGPGRMVVTAVK